MLCDSCGENQATMFLTQVVNGDVAKLRLCETCARTRALGSDWAKQFDENQDVPLEQIVRDLFEEMEQQRQDNDAATGAALYNEVYFGLQNDALFEEDEFPSDEDLADSMDEDEDFDDLPDDIAEELAAAEQGAKEIFGSGDDLLGEPRERRDIHARRCPKCSITWDRLRQDGRAGCAQCYEAFADQLHEVMQRVQHAPEHRGKKPRAAEKRRNRLEHLRTRRDHRLEMLNRRLEEAVRDERYEEAAKLRDQIKMVSSTIVRDDI